MSSYVLVDYLTGVPELVEELGGDLSHLVKESGLPSNIFNKSQKLIPYASCGYLLEAAARQLEHPDFALLLSRKRQEMGYAHEIISFSRAAKNVCLAIQGHVDHLRTRTLGIQYTLETENEIAWFSRTLSPQDSTRFPQGTILMFATMYNNLKDVSDNKWAPSSISFTFKKTDNIAALKKYFRCPIQFDADLDAIFFNKDLLTLPLPTRDDSMHEMLSKYLTSLHLSGSSDFRELVASMIQKNLSVGRSDIDALALRMPYKTRTIQKKLQDIDTSYKEILNDTRFELAENLMQNSDNPLTYIAQKLCFQDLSSFSKAFKNRYGISPREWKKQVNSH